MWHEVEGSNAPPSAILLHARAVRSNTGITLTLLELNECATNVSLSVTNGSPPESSIVVSLPACTGAVTVISGTAVLCFPSGPGCPNNDQLGFQIGVGTLVDEQPPDPDQDDDGLPDE